MYFTAVPLKDRKGNTTGAIETLQDFTERKKAEEELRESERKYRAITEKSHDAIFIVGEDGFLFLNDRTSEVTGYSKEELYSMNWPDLLHPEDRERVKEIDRKGRKDNEAPTRYEARILTKEGEVKHGDFKVTPIEYEGEFAVLGTLRDITELKKREKNLKESEERREFLNTLLRQDLGSKCRTIQGYLQLLEEADLEDKYREYLKKSIKIGKEEDEILGLAKKLEEIEGTELVGEKDVGKVLKQVLDGISDFVEREGVEIESHFPEKMDKVRGDYSLHIIFAQILLTRVQISRVSRFRIEAREKEKGVLVRIEDDGESLPRDIKDMFSGKSYTGETTGVGGVRYYMIRQIAEHNNAEIEVKNSDLGGNMFNIYLQKA